MRASALTQQSPALSLYHRRISTWNCSWPKWMREHRHEIYRCYAEWTLRLFLTWQDISLGYEIKILKRKWIRKKKKPIKIHSWKERDAYHYTRGAKTLRYNINCITHFPITIRPQLSSIAHCFCPLKLGRTTLLTWNRVKISQSHWTQG